MNSNKTATHYNLPIVSGHIIVNPSFKLPKLLTSSVLLKHCFVKFRKFSLRIKDLK